MNTNWAFVHAPQVGRDGFDRVLERVTGNWAERHGLAEARFVVKAKWVERAPNR